MSTTRADHVDQVDVLGLEHGGPGVEAADLEQVGQERLEAVELLLQQLGRATGDRVEERPGVVDDVAGHPHGGDRRAQLVGDVGDEAPLEPAELLELADLLLEVGGHLVERRREPRQVVLAGDAQALLQLPGGQPLGDPAGHPDRGHHLAGHQPRQPRDEQQQRDAGDEHRPRDERERLLLLGQRVEVVERVGVVVGREPDLAADHDAGAVGRPWSAAWCGCRCRSRPSGRRVEAGLERLRDAGQVEALGELRAAVGQPGAVADRRGQHHGEAARGSRAPGSARRAPAAGPTRRRRCRAWRPAPRGRPRSRPAASRTDGLDPVVEQPVTGLLHEEPADDADDRRREQERARPRRAPAPSAARRRARAAAPAGAGHAMLTGGS